jgi:hypothetical protein
MSKKLKIWLTIGIVVVIIVATVIAIILITKKPPQQPLPPKPPTPSPPPPIPSNVRVSKITSSTRIPYPRTSYIQAGEYLTSEDETTYLYQQADANLVLFYKGEPIWSTGIVGKYSNPVTVIDGFGYLVTYPDMGSANGGKYALWTSAAHINIDAIIPLLGAPYTLTVKPRYFEVTNRDEVCLYSAPDVKPCATHIV